MAETSREAATMAMDMFCVGDERQGDSWMKT